MIRKIGGWKIVQFAEQIDLNMGMFSIFEEIRVNFALSFYEPRPKKGKTSNT